MKAILCHFLRLVLFAATMGIAQARPWWHTLDESGDDFPARYGYDVHRFDEGDLSRFSITVDPVAAKVLQSAELLGGKAGDPPVELSGPDAEGRRTIGFFLPTAELPTRSLRLNSGPVPLSGHEGLDNFHGYSLLLASVPIEDPKQLTIGVKVTAQRSGGQIEFALTQAGRGIELASKGMPPWDITSCTLEGSLAGGPVIIPLGIVPSGYPESTTRFTLPASQVSGLILKFKLSGLEQGHFQTKQVRVGLARIAAGAE